MYMCVNEIIRPKKNTIKNHLQLFKSFVFLVLKNDERRFSRMPTTSLILKDSYERDMNSDVVVPNTDR